MKCGVFIIKKTSANLQLPDITPQSQLISHDASGSPHSVYLPGIIQLINLIT